MKRRSLKTIYGLLFMSGRAVRVVNLITLYRIITFPLLILFIFTGHENVFKWLLLVSFSTDAVDGYLARKYKAVSALGSKLDSIGDDLTVLAGLIGFLRLNAQFFREEIYVIGGLFFLFFIQLTLSVIKYKKPSSFHTYLAKTAALLQGIFLLSVFFFKTTNYLLFYSAAVITALELVEEIILVLLLPVWQTDMKGLYWVLKRKRGKQ